MVRKPGRECSDTPSLPRPNGPGDERRRHGAPGSMSRRAGSHRRAVGADLGVGTERLAFRTSARSAHRAPGRSRPPRPQPNRPPPGCNRARAFGRVNGGATFRTSITPPPGRLPRLTVMRSPASPSFGSGPIMPATSSHSRARSVSPGGRSLRDRPSSPSSRTALRRVGTARSSRTCSRPDRGDVATLSSS